MRNVTMTVLAAVAMLGFAAPALAHENDRNSRHDWQHDRLDQRHDDVHDRLDDEHADAHDYGLSPWEHRQLHRQLAYDHDRADARIARDHRREHRRDDWQRRDDGYGWRY
ncbi:hypothetical protein [Novosphingobium sp.]|uniref:hypothetical protein n=1 Tax=Novosphingobium sp. TaxID=1874826 RepID=UPI0026012C8D|nr:hypothetical protein [Novosphingobium sp.]